MSSKKQIVHYIILLLTNRPSSCTVPRVLKSCFCLPLTYRTFDREKKSSYAFDVQASDGGKYDKRSERTRIRVTIGDINDNAPVFQEALYRANVTMGSAAGTHVLTVVADDKDTGLNGKVTYRFSSASDAKALQLFSIGESSGYITAKQSLDLHTVGYHNLKVVASDGGNVSLSTTGELTFKKK